VQGLSMKKFHSMKFSAGLLLSCMLHGSTFRLDMEKTRSAIVHQDSAVGELAQTMASLSEAEQMPAQKRQVQIEDADKGELDKTIQHLESLSDLLFLNEPCNKAAWDGHPLIFVRHYPFGFVAEENGKSYAHISESAHRNASEAGRGLCKYLSTMGLGVAEAYWQKALLADRVAQLAAQGGGGGSTAIEKLTNETFEEIGSSCRASGKHFPEGSAVTRFGFRDLFQSIEEGRRPIGLGAVVVVSQNGLGPQVEILHNAFDEEELESFRMGLPDTARKPKEKFGPPGQWTKSMQQSWGKWYYEGWALVLTCSGAWQLEAVNLLSEAEPTEQ